ncbi:MAG: hypothetical protein EOO11_16820 [Chitinophagaceae bacterium]|nr:MAG: hypothetical protein EOO11_16820 [Chitinophagaceae bacterium]
MTTNATACRLLALLLLLCCISRADAQVPTLQWIRDFAAPGNPAYAETMALDSGRALLVAGDFRNTLDLDAGPGTATVTSNGDVDIFLTRYDTAGRFVWARSIGGPLGDACKQVRIDRNGDILLIGYFQGTVDFDPGPGVHLETTNFSNNFLLKLDRAGNFKWVRRFDMAYLDRFDVDAQGNIFLGGSFGGATDFDPGPGTATLTAGLLDFDLYVLKLDATGNYAWAKQFPNTGGGFQRVLNLRLDKAGAIYLAGSFYNSMDADPDAGVSSLTSNGQTDAYILKLNAQGGLLWARSWGGPENEEAWGLEVDAAGSVYTSGSFINETVDFDPGTGSAVETTVNRRAYLSKFNAQGLFTWVRTPAGGFSFGQSVAVDSTQNVYLSGGYSGTVDFDPGLGSYTLPTGHLYTWKLSSAGNLAWAAGYVSQTIGGYQSIYNTTLVDAAGSVYFMSGIGGSYTVDFDPGPGTALTTAVSSWDGFMLKLSPCSRITTVNASACSSYTFNGATYTSSGTYYYTFPGTCDSIVQLNLALTGAQHQSLAVSACQAYNWNGTLLTTSGHYIDTFATTAGCDSIVDLDLTIKPLPVVSLGADTAVCTGDTLHLLAAATGAAYLWSTGATTPDLLVTSPGTYWVQATVNGCVATDTVHVAGNGACNDCSLTAESWIGPVPFGNWIRVHKNATRCTVLMDLYNAIGQLVLKEHALRDGSNTVYLYGLAAGNYYYVLHSEGKVLQRGVLRKQ